MARRRRNPEIIAGRVNGDGSIATGDGFTVQRTATGTYIVTLGAGFRLTAVTATVGAGTTLATSVTSPTASSFQVNVYAASTAAANDQIFHFVAVGVQQ